MQLAADFSLSGLIKKYIEDLFDEKEVSEENREKLWTHYYNKLSSAVDIGYSPKSVHWDEPLVKALKQNIAEFSAFKETSFRKTLEELLTTDGKLTPKNEFLKQAYKVSGDYNHRWLETEYHQTIANAQSAEKWKDFEANAELYPNLKLVTVRDARVRPEHKVLDGVIRPINDPFWDTHMTPLDWGCRCDVEQTDEEPTEVKGGIQMKLEFKNNPAKTGKIFNGSAYQKSMTKEEIKETKKFADYCYIKLESEPGKVTFGKNVDSQDFKRNLEVAKILAKNEGADFHIRDHVEIEGFKNPEYLINNKYLGDRKSIKSSNGIITQIDKAKEQMLHESVNPNKNPYCIVWDFDEIENLNLDEIERNLSRKITKTRGTKVQGMYFQYKGKSAYLSRQMIVDRFFEPLWGLK